MHIYEISSHLNMKRILVLMKALMFSPLYPTIITKKK